MKIGKLNRIKKTQPLADRSAWCGGCDMYLVKEGERCPKCGSKQPTKHFKKGMNDMEEQMREEL